MNEDRIETTLAMRLEAQEVLHGLGMGRDEAARLIGKLYWTGWDHGFDVAVENAKEASARGEVWV